MIPLPLQALILLLLSPILLYIVAIRRNGYWRKRGIPGPKPYPLRGNFDSLYGTHPTVLQFWEWTKQYGRVYGIQYGWFQALVISEPKMIHEMLVDKFEQFHCRLLSPIEGDVDTKPGVDIFTARGMRWKRIRTISNPSFSVANLKKVMPIMSESIHETLRLLEEANREGKPLNLTPHFVEMTSHVISRVALGQREYSQFGSEYTRLVRASLARFNTNIFDYWSWLLPWAGFHVIGPMLRWTGKLWGDPFELIAWKVAEAVKKHKMERQLGTRSTDDEEGTDFIDMFLELEKDGPLEQEQQRGAEFSKKDMKFERHLRTEEVIFNCIIFLLAGFDTTANTMSNMSHYLALFPEVQEKMREEIEQICIYDENPSYEQLNQLKYCEAAIKETLRLVPLSSYVLNRVAKEDTSLGGLAIEKGTAVFTDVFTLHRDKTIWGEDAEQFRPERWFEPMGTAQNVAFAAFGGGPRICIGMRFAILELKMAMCHLLRKFVLKRCEQTEEELVFQNQAVLDTVSVVVQLEER